MTDLNAECEKAWAAYRIAHNQAMSNGAALQEAQAEVLALSAHVAELEGVAADAVSGLRYIEHRYGRLEGVGWDRVFDAHDKLAALTKEAVVDGQ